MGINKQFTSLHIFLSCSYNVLRQEGDHGSQPSPIWINVYINELYTHQPVTLKP